MAGSEALAALLRRVLQDLAWRSAVEAPRCQHCLEIVGQYRRTESPSNER
jgi:hypothetical protein